MKQLFSLFILLTMPSLAVAKQCPAPKLARDSVRAIALISDRAMITDLVGGCNESTCQVWANYRKHGYADHYEVTTDAQSCRVTSVRLLEENQPVREGDTAFL